MTVLMPDTSEFQSGAGAPDWAGIKKQNGGAGIIRVGYGSGKLDAMFVSNYTALKANKYSFIGLYHYLRAGQDAAAQADQFCKWVGPPSAVYPGTVFICDLEEGSGNQSARANAWLGHVDSFYGLDKQPLNLRSWLYSYTSFVASHNLASIFASPRRTWIAAYSSTEPAIGHTLWQCTDGTNGSNITRWAGCGKVDTSLYHGTLDQLSALGWKNQAPVPPVPPVPPTPPPFHGEWVTAGQLSLAALAATFKLSASTLLRMTAVHYGSFNPELALYVNGVHAGTTPPTAPIPAGAKVWVN